MYNNNILLEPMRKEVTEIGFIELKTRDEVKEAIKNFNDTILIFVNSVCGCAAGAARPALKLAMNNKIFPQKLFTVFAGQDKEATEETRKYFVDFAPSSPSIWLLKNEKVIASIERWEIEGNSPETIANSLINIFNEHCKK